MTQDEMTSEMLFCVKYLYQQGYFPPGTKDVEKLLRDNEIDDYQLVKIQKGNFFIDLAGSLRNLWPSGEKAGKYPWRDSVANLSKRLQALWNMRDLSKYTINDCLVAARKYLSQFETNVTYMRTLKYFIYKQNRIVEKDGKVRYTYESPFADILEGLSSLEKQNEWATLEASTEYQPIEQGVLI